MADEKQDKTIFTSYVGTFKADSFSVDDNGVASAVLETARSGEKVVKGYKDRVEILKNAVAAGGEQIINGSLLGGGANPHLSITRTGPEQITGAVSKVRDSFDTEGKQPFVRAFMRIEVGDDKKVGKEVKAFGDDALALKGLKDGDRLSVPARQTQDKVTDKDGNEKWESIYLVTGPGKIEPGVEKAADAEAPTP